MLQATSLLHDHSLVSENLRKSKEEYDSSARESDKRYERDVKQLSEQLEHAKLALGDASRSATRQVDLEKHLTQVGQELLKIQEQLDMTEKVIIMVFQVLNVHNMKARYVY